MFNKKVFAVGLAGALAVALAGCTSISDVQPSTSASNNGSVSSEVSAAPLPSLNATAQPIETGVVDSTRIVKADAQADLLVYLIEEEKLAHDVYFTLEQLWGSRVLSNILNSEISHQEQVLSLLNVREIADPRSTQIGVFKNTQLQKLYDDLIAKGSKSVKDAFEVGVAIEELDIADITEMLAETLDSDVISTLERLRSASENHLRAFNRQL